MDWAATLKRGIGRGARHAERPQQTASARRRRPRDRRDKTPKKRPTILPWYLIVLGVAVAASTSAAQKRAVTLLTATDDTTDPLPDVAPDWLKESRSARSFWTIINRVVLRMGQDNLTLVAAGIAFYAMFSVFPALGALVSIYGIFGDAHMVQAQVAQLTELLPQNSAKLLTDALNALLAKPAGSLNFGLLVSLGLAIWSARACTSSLMTGLNVALERPETRSFLKQNAMAIILTIGAIIFAIVALAAVAVVPLVIGFLPVDDTLKAWLAYARWPMLGAFILLALDVVYRFGPSARRPRWQLISVGTILAAVLWIVGSWAFSLYVTRFGSYDSTYGSLGAVVVLLLWFWMSALIVLLGATIDAVRAEMRR